jgi:hypothetical protein
MHRDHEVWRVKGRNGGGVIVCTIHERADTVGVRTTLRDGTILRSRLATSVEAARTIAAEWLYAIRDLVVDERVWTH